MSTCVRSYCKINLGLAVGPSRSDGFHALTTMYQTLGLHDLVTVTARRAIETKITLTANHHAVPRTETGTAERNTAWKMVSAVLERLGVAAEVEIDINKRLPVQGGLGAGSANAMAALVGLERELRTALSGAERLSLAAKVGSDVPLFLLGGAVLGLGRGEQVFPLPDFEPMHCVVAIPKVGVSTAQAFRELDARAAIVPRGLKPLFPPGQDGGAKAPPLQSSLRQASFERHGLQHSESALRQAGFEGDGLQPVRESSVRGGVLAPEANTYTSLTYPQPPDRLEELSRALAAVWTTSGVEDGAPRGTTGIVGRPGDLAENPLLALVRTGIENDFEEVAFSQHPSLRSIKRELMGEDPEAALYAALSGSGSALFGLYKSLEDARAAQQRVQNAGTQALLTETLPRKAYWTSIFAE